MRTRITAAALAAALTPLALTLSAPAAHAVPAAAPYDFNGDGRTDLAIGAPGATVAGQARAGAVSVVYGSSSGPKTSTRTLLTQNTAGMPGAAEADDAFGSALASADLNTDGYADLLIGTPGEDGSDSNDGTVTIVWGGASGLSGARSLFSFFSTDYDRYGRALTAGDFDGDGKADLAASAYADPYVLRGPFTTTGTTGAVQRVALPEASYSVDAMAAGDTNDDGRSDLALTYRVHLDSDESGSWSKGAAYLGTATGLDTSLPRPLDGGTSLALGDIDGDGYDEIALGNVFTEEDDHSGSLGGRVVVIRGSEGGPVNGDAPMAELTQDSEGVPGADEANDGFGSAVSIGDTDGDGYGDLAIGVVFEDVGTIEDSGATILMNGSASGVSRTGARTFTQDTAGVPGSAEAIDYFGSDVLLADVTKDGHAEFTVTAGFEDEGIGAITALRGSATGPVTDGARTFGPGSLGQIRSYGAFGAGLIG